MKQTQIPKAAKPGPKSIFLVESWKPLLELLQLHLQAQGYQVTPFMNHQAAFDAFACADPRPSLLITNYGTDSPGVDLMKCCTATEPCLNVILCSGRSEILESIPASPSHFRFIPKPFPLAVLDFNVHSLIGYDL